MWRAWHALQAQHSSGLPRTEPFRGCTGLTIRCSEEHQKISIHSIFTSERTSRLANDSHSCQGVREAGPSRGRFALPQPTPLEQIPVQFSGARGRRQCKSQAVTAADLPRQATETDYGRLVRFIKNVMQSHARQATLCLSGLGQMEIAINQLLSCEGPPERSKETAGGCRRSPAQPAPAQPSPPLPSPTPSTSTCSRRAAKAKARGKGPRTMAKLCQVDGSRTRLVWLVGGRGHGMRLSIRRALPRTGDHIRGCTGLTIRGM